MWTPAIQNNLNNLSINNIQFNHNSADNWLTQTDAMTLISHYYMQQQGTFWLSGKYCSEHNHNMLDKKSSKQHSQHLLSYSTDFKFPHHIIIIIAVLVLFWTAYDVSIDTTHIKLNGYNLKVLHSCHICNCLLTYSRLHIQSIANFTWVGPHMVH